MLNSKVLTDDIFRREIKSLDRYEIALRDLGLKYLAFSAEESKQVINLKKIDTPIFSSDYLGFFADMCGNESSCNHTNNPMAAFDSVKIQSLPATAVFKLWHAKQKKKLKPPDFRFVLEFQ